MQLFWNRLRTTAELIAHRSVVHSPRLDAERIEKALRSAPEWLTPRCVAGYDKGDFAFLAEVEQDELEKHVEEFRRIAWEIHPNVSPTEEQIERALPSLIAIVEMLEFDRYGDLDAYQIGKRIEREIEPERPSTLAELRFETGWDNTGDPSLWIWAVLTDKAAGKKDFATNTRTIRELLTSAARTVDAKHWPYVRFRTVSEQVELQLLGASA